MANALNFETTTIFRNFFNFQISMKVRSASNVVNKFSIFSLGCVNENVFVSF